MNALLERPRPTNTFPYFTQHSSMEFHDRGKKAAHDIRVLFEKDDAEKFKVKTFTEVGPETDLHGELKEACKDHDYRVSFFRSNAVAVSREIIKPGTWVAGSVFVEDGSTVYGPGHDSGFAFGSWEMRDGRVGDCSHAALHYPTKGRPGMPNESTNRRYAYELAKWMRHAGRGTALAFASGDFNMNDADPRQDWAWGESFTSIADILGRHPATSPYGPIDGMVKYDRDRRTKAGFFNVLDDNEFFLHSDHWFCRARWDVKLLAA